MPVVTILWAVLALLRAAGAQDDLLEAPSAQGAHHLQQTRHLRVTGEGQVSVAPDIALVQLGVDTRAGSVAAAMTANSQAVAQLLQALDEAGVAGQDVRTTEFTVRRVVESPSRPRGEDLPPPKVKAFVVRNLVQVTIRDLSRLGRILDVALGAGANQMHGLRFGLAEERAARDRARTLAVADARHRAEQLVRLHGVRLGQVLRIIEHGGGTARPEPMLLRASDAGRGAPIRAGDLTFRTGVEVTYELKD